MLMMMMVMMGGGGGGAAASPREGSPEMMIRNKAIIMAVDIMRDLLISS